MGIVSIPRYQTINDAWSGSKTNYEVIAANAQARTVVNIIIFSSNLTGSVKLIQNLGGSRTDKMGPIYNTTNGGFGADQIVLKFARGAAVEITTTGAGDPTHQWPPISEMFFYYIRRDWRMANAPHTDSTNWPDGYSCDFDATWGYSMRQDILARNQEYQQYALANLKEAAQDTVATLTKR